MAPRRDDMVEQYRLSSFVGILFNQPTFSEGTAVYAACTACQRFFGEAAEAGGAAGESVRKLEPRALRETVAGHRDLPGLPGEAGRGHPARGHGRGAVLHDLHPHHAGPPGEHGLCIVAAARGGKKRIFWMPPLPNWQDSLRGSGRGALLVGGKLTAHSAKYTSKLSRHVIYA